MKVNKTKKPTLFQLPKKFALHFKSVFFILQIYVLILIFGIITTVNGFLFYYYYSFQHRKANENTGQTDSLSVCWICLRVCSVSDCIAFFL